VPSQKIGGTKIAHGINFFSILWCKWSGDQPQDDLVRFGNKKHESNFFKHPLKNLATYWNLGDIMGIVFSNFDNLKKNHTPFSSFWKKKSMQTKCYIVHTYVVWQYNNIYFLQPRPFLYLNMQTMRYNKSYPYKVNLTKTHVKKLKRCMSNL
jgi:hypothetical protein